MFEEPIVVQTWLGLMTRSGLQIQPLVYIDLSLWLIWIALSWSLWQRSSHDVDCCES